MDENRYEAPQESLATLDLPGNRLSRVSRWVGVILLAALVAVISLFAVLWLT